ncbi:uncharacterized protein LOC141814438 [Curcuma longa]|uniref:uncharacterized protein LOC141814438 n=1 Tax=Curcuma longa TaxID=136217 RepID=UPI003D9DB21E
MELRSCTGEVVLFFDGSWWLWSEAECPDHAFLNRDLNDLYWWLSISVGVMLDLPLVNPFGPESPGLEAAMHELMLMVMGERDLLCDEATEYATRQTTAACNVQCAVCDGGSRQTTTSDRDRRGASRAEQGEGKKSRFPF